MHRLQKYLLSNFSALFISLFLPLFVIASVIFLIKLSSYTAVIQLSILEMGKLYLFILPKILFYTLPITFFISATLSLFKLSNDNEIIVIFALGIEPGFIIRTFFKPAFILSALLAFDFLVVSPYTNTLSKNFLSYKKSEAKFNLAASEFGNSFGDWLLYIGAKNKDATFSKIFLFNKKQEEEILISAKRAKLINESGLLKLKLMDGEGYSYSKKKFSQINFKTMIINDALKANLTSYEHPLQYWLSKEHAKRKKHLLIKNTLLSLFPMITLFLIATIGVVQVRHQKSKVYLHMFLGIVLFYGMTIGLEKIFQYYTIPIVSLSWLILSYTFYRKSIVNKF